MSSTASSRRSANTGVDFAYLMAQAAKESGFNPDAKSKASSAAGLYQFVEQTWLVGRCASMVRSMASATWPPRSSSARTASCAWPIGAAQGDPRPAPRSGDRSGDGGGACRRQPAAPGSEARPRGPTDRSLSSRISSASRARPASSARWRRMRSRARPTCSPRRRPPTSRSSIAPTARSARCRRSTIASRAAWSARWRPMTISKARSFAGETMLADVRSSRGNAGGVSGDGAIFGQTSPGGMLSPLMMVTLAALPTGRDRDEAMARTQQPVQPRHRSATRRRSASHAPSLFAPLVTPALSRGPSSQSHASGKHGSRLKAGMTSCKLTRWRVEFEQAQRGVDLVPVDEVPAFARSACTPASRASADW